MLAKELLSRESCESPGVRWWTNSTGTIYVLLSATYNIASLRHASSKQQQIERVGRMVGLVASFGGLCPFLYDEGRLQAGNASRARFLVTRKFGQASAHILLSTVHTIQITPIIPTSLLFVTLKWWSMLSYCTVQSE